MTVKGTQNDTTLATIREWTLFESMHTTCSSTIPSGNVAEEPKGRNREFQSMHFLGLGKKPLYLYEHNVTANLMRKEVSENKKRKARKILLLENLYTQQ